MHVNIDILSLVRKSLNSYSFIKNLNKIINVIRIIAVSISIFVFGINVLSIFKNM